MLLSQGTLVLWCGFAGNAFIRWSKVGFWIWLSESSLYTWATRGLMIAIYSRVNYYCPQQAVTWTSNNAANCVANDLV